MGLLSLSLPACGTSEGDGGVAPGPEGASGKADEFGTATDGDTDTDTGGVIGTTDWGSSSGYWGDTDTETDGWDSASTDPWWGTSSSGDYCGTDCGTSTGEWGGVGTTGASTGADSASGTTD